MAELPKRVIKLGGSLLDLADLPERFRRWLVAQPPADNALVCGGGALVDAIRRADRTHRLGEEASHWLAIRAMDVTAHLLAELLPEAAIIDDIDLAERSQTQRLRICKPLAMLQEAEATDPQPLPHSWEITSDSIAACLAQRWGARELVLLKSTLIDEPNNRLVDRHFRRQSIGIPSIRCVNLRDDTFSERWPY